MRLTPELPVQLAVVVTSPEALRGQRFELGKPEQAIGRDSDSDIVLDDPYVSRRHAVMRRAGSAIVIEDCDSSPGTIINGARISEPTLLHLGDRIRLGEVELEICGGPESSLNTLAGGDQALLDATLPPGMQAEPVLVVSSPGTSSGRRFTLVKHEQSIGRAPDNDIVLDDPHVSRRHAVMRRAGAAILIEDCDSSAGTFINGARISQPTLLHGGDRIRIAEVELELLGGPSSALASSGRMEPAAAPAQPQFQVENQGAGVISNVGRDQYNYDVRIAPMRRRARQLMWLGFALFLSGLIVYIIGWAEWARPILTCIQNNGSCTSPSTTGFVIAAAGAVLVMLGIVVFVASLLIRRQARLEEQRL
jgi:pSer/pThr/pTyr-binding forkhead associated (FHA) protein